MHAGALLSTDVQDSANGPSCVLWTGCEQTACEAAPHSGITE